MMEVAQFAVCSQVNTKHIIQCGQSKQFLNWCIVGASRKQ
jgi:hypothetical protein